LYSVVRTYYFDGRYGEELGTGRRLGAEVGDEEGKGRLEWKERIEERSGRK